MKDTVGVIHGRFQMLHLGHMEYLLAGKARCERLLIGVSNPDASLVKYSAANPHRSAASSNPLTYYERFEMLRGAMLEAGVPREEFDIVPFPINYPELLFNYVPRDAKFYMTLYDEWSEEKLRTLQGLGCAVEVMWRRSNAEKAYSGTEVRRRIVRGEAWSQMVPPSVFAYARAHGLEERIRALAADGDADLISAGKSV
ncbi:MAG: adenylyltransferase/cytidyltransferase family protein [Oscillospiraceae bacterium]